MENEFLSLNILLTDNKPLLYCEPAWTSRPKLPLAIFHARHVIFSLALLFFFYMYLYYRMRIEGKRWKIGKYRHTLDGYEMALCVSIERSRLTDRDKTVPSLLLSPSTLNDDCFPPPPSFCWYLKYWISFSVGWLRERAKETWNGCLLSVFRCLLGLLESLTGHNSTHTHLTMCATALLFFNELVTRRKM